MELDLKTRLQEYEDLKMDLLIEQEVFRILEERKNQSMWINIFNPFLFSRLVYSPETSRYTNVDIKEIIKQRLESYDSKS